MPIFVFSASITVSAYTTVEAENKEEALKMATQRPVEIYTGYDSREASKEAWLVEEADGEPMNIDLSL